MAVFVEAPHGVPVNTALDQLFELLIWLLKLPAHHSVSKTGGLLQLVKSMLSYRLEYARADTCSRTISRPNLSRRAATGPVDQYCSKDLNAQSGLGLDSMRISRDINAHQDCNPIENAIDANLGTSGVDGHPSGTERTHRKLKCSKLLPHMFKELRNEKSVSATSTTARHSAGVLRAGTRVCTVHAHTTSLLTWFR